MNRAVILAATVTLMIGLCLCSLLTPINPVETDPSRPITVEVGDTFDIVTLWDGTHLKAADESAVEVDYDERKLTLTEERSQSRRSFVMGGLNLFYHIAAFEATASGETEVTLRVPDEAWVSEVEHDRNHPIAFQVMVQP